MSFKTMYIPIGVPTFDLEVAGEDFRQSIQNLSNYLEVEAPEEPLLSLDSLVNFIKGQEPDLAIVQNLTFAGSHYMTQIQKYIKCPILLWTLKERFVDGGRLRLNSLTGAYSASNLLYMLEDDRLFYIYGESSDPAVGERAMAIARAIQVKDDLKELNIASVGFTPDGFGFGQATSMDLLKKFGSNYMTVEARELMEKAESYQEGEYEDSLKGTHFDLEGYDFLKKEQIDRTLRLYKAYMDFVKKNNIGALSSRCWPDFFTRYSAPVCGILSVLNDELIGAACEGDLYGALSLFIANHLSDKPAFFGDPVHIDLEENLIYFWHCGMGACSLSNDKRNVGVHPNRKMGPTMEFVSKAEKEITVFRVGKQADGEARFLITTGEVVEKEKPFQGTSAVVRLDSDVLDYVEETVGDGWEPHFVVIYKDVVRELEALAKLLGIDVYRY